MQDQRPDEEQAETDDQNQRRGPQPLVQQPARLGRELGTALRDHAFVGEKAVEARRCAVAGSGADGPRSCHEDRA